MTLKRLTKVRMCDRDQPPRPFLQTHAAQMRRAELGSHDIDVRARRGNNGIVQRRNDSAELAAARCRWKSDDRLSAARAARRAHIIDLPADRADIGSAG